MIKLVLLFLFNKMSISVLHPTSINMRYALKKFLLKEKIHEFVNKKLQKSFKKQIAKNSLRKRCFSESDKVCCDMY